jgi:phosphotransferase system enzyme I (PtsI)
VNEHATIAGLAYKGQIASIGFAHGPLVRADSAMDCERVAAAPSDERAALRAALISAGRQIAELAAGGIIGMCSPN